MLGWVGKHIPWYTPSIIVKPTNSPTQGQPSPRKIRLKVALGPLFFPSQQIIFRGLGLIFGRETDYEKPNPTKFSSNTVTKIA